MSQIRWSERRGALQRRFLRRSKGFTPVAKGLFDRGDNFGGQPLRWRRIVGVQRNQGGLALDGSMLGDDPAPPKWLTTEVVTTIEERSEEHTSELQSPDH